MLKGFSIVAFGLGVLLSRGPARADYTLYTQRAIFESSLKNEMTETFNEVTAGKSFPSGLSQSDGLTQPITVTGTAGSLNSGNSSQNAGFYPNNGTYLIGPIGPGTITVTLPTKSYTAIGADVTAFASSSMVTISGTTSLGEKFSETIKVDGSTQNSPLGFLGVTTSSPTDYVTSVSFSTPSGSAANIVVDNVSFGQSAVPEPASMALFAAGALALGASAIRRRVAPATA